MNAVFNINKPAGMTSNDVVCIMRKILNMKKGLKDIHLLSRVNMQLN